MATATLRVGASIGEFTKATRQISSELKTVDSDIKAVSSQAKIGADKTDAFAQKQDLLKKKMELCSSAIQLQKNRIETISGTLETLKNKHTELASKIQTTTDKYNKAVSAYGKNSDEAKTLKTELEKLEKQQKANDSSIDANVSKLNTAKQKLADVKTAASETRGELANLEEQMRTEKIDAFSSSLETIGSKLTTIGGLATATITAPLIGIGVSAVKLVSDYEEALNKVEVAFGVSSESVIEFANTTLETFGIAKGEALNMASAFGDMGTSLGLTQQDAADMSEELVGLAGDLASFKNISTDQAFTALSGIFTGETESLKTLGIVMTETNLNAYALAEGYGKTTDEMTQAEKVQLRYNYILSVTSNAQGDYARTADGTANSARTFQGAIKELGTSFGEELLPEITPVIQDLTKLIKKFDEMSASQKQSIVKMLELAAAIGPVVLLTGKLTTGLGKGIKALSTFTSAINVLKTGTASAVPEVASLAGTLKTLTSPTALAVAGVVALAAAAYGLNEAFNKNLPALREQREEYNKIKSSVDDAASSTQNYIDSTDASLASSGAQIQTAETLAGKIEDLADKQNRSATENATLNAMILEFNGIVPDANLAIDSNTGTLNLNRDAIQEVIDKRKEQLRVEAVASASKDATSQQLENAMALNDAAAELNDLKAQEREELSKVDPNLSQNEQLRQRGAIQARYNSQIQALQSSISDLEAEQEKLNDKMSDYNKMIDDPSYYDTYINSASEAADAANNLADANDGVGDAKAGADAAVGDTTAQDTFEGANKDAEASVSSLNQNGSKSAYDFMANYNAAMGQSTTGGTNAFTAGVLTGVPKISSGFSNWISAAMTVMQPLIPNLNAFGVSGGENFSSGLKSQDGNVSNAAELLKQAAMNPFGSIGQDGNIFGLSFGNNIGSGIGSTQGNVQTNSGILKNAATSPFLGFGAEGGGIGWGFGSGISTGIGNTKSSVSTSSTDVKQNAMLSPFSGISASGTGIGSNYIAGIDQGQQNKKADLEAGSTTLVDLMKSTFFSGLKISSPSKVGVYIGENWIQGLMNGMEDNDLISFTKGIISEFTSLFTSGNLSIQSLTSMMGDNISKVLQMMGIGTGSGGNWPVNGEITSYFGYRDSPTAGASTYHEGIDIAAALGTAVSAFQSGVVQFAGDAGGYGNQVIIDHLNGLVTYYSHLNDIMVSAGQTVTAGSQIGTVGSTGISTGPHLDFRTQQNGTFVDPLTYLNGSASTSSSGGDVESWVTQALIATGMYNAQNLANTVALAMAESGGDPNAINLWDSNAAAGHPSKGLMQTIDSTFNAYAMAGHTNIWDPVDNAIASIRYQMSRYGYLRATPGYAVGTRYLPQSSLIYAHQGEAIIPANQNPYTNSGGQYLEEIVEKVVSTMGSSTPGVNIYVYGDNNESEIARKVGNVMKKGRVIPR